MGIGTAPHLGPISHLLTTCAVMTCVLTTCALCRQTLAVLLPESNQPALASGMNRQLLAARGGLRADTDEPLLYQVLSDGQQPNSGARTPQPHSPRSVRSPGPHSPGLGRPLADCNMQRVVDPYEYDSSNQPSNCGTGNQPQARSIDSGPQNSQHRPQALVTIGSGGSGRGGGSARGMAGMTALMNAHGQQASSGTKVHSALVSGWACGWLSVAECGWVRQDRRVLPSYESLKPRQNASLGVWKKLMQTWHPSNRSTLQMAKPEMFSTVFECLDADGDQMISKQEFGEGLAQMGLKLSGA